MSAPAGNERLSRSPTATDVTVKATDDYGGLEESNSTHTIHLSAEAEVRDDERGTDTDENECGDHVSSSLASAVAVPVGSRLHSGGIPVNEDGSRAFRNRPEFISVCVIKPTRRAELGLFFSDLVDGGEGLIISGIGERGVIAYAGAPLEVGDRVVSINNQSCDRGMDHRRAVTLLREASGPVSLVCHNIGGNPLLVECMITKPSPGHQTGIGLSSSEEPPQVNVCSVFRNGLFSESLLSEGDEVISINTIPCRQLNASAAADIIISAPKYVTIVAKKLEGNGVVVAFEGITMNEKRKRRAAAPNSISGRTLVGPGCQLLFVLIGITAVVILILYLQVYRKQM